MDVLSSPIRRARVSYSYDHVRSLSPASSDNHTPTSIASPAPSTANPQAPVTDMGPAPVADMGFAASGAHPANAASLLPPVRNPSAIRAKKRQRAASEEVERLRKRVVGPYRPRVQSGMLLNPSSLSQSLSSIKANRRSLTATPRKLSALPATRNIANEARRDSGFHQEAEKTEPQDKLVSSTPATQEEDSGFHDAGSDLGQERGHSKNKSTPQRTKQPGQAAPVTDTSTETTPAKSQVTLGEEQFYDAPDSLSDAPDPSGALSSPKKDRKQTVHAKPQIVAAQTEASIDPPIPKDSMSKSSSAASQSNHNTSKPSRGASKLSSGASQSNQNTPTPGRGSSNASSVASAAGDDGQQAINVEGFYGGGAKDAIVVSAAEDDDSIHVNPGDESEEEDEDTEYDISRISKHRINPKTDEIELLVHWENLDDEKEEKPSWVSEETLQPSGLEAVTEYWATVDGGRVSVAPYQVYRIKGHQWLKKGKARAKSLYLEVEWLGYEDTSAEPWRRFAKDQPDMVQEYFESIGGQPQRP